MKLRWKKRTAGEQRGAFIVFTALALWFLMMFIAFSVDFGNYYQHRSRLQNAADAAALAGVAEYTTEEIAKNTGVVAAPTLSKGRLVTLVEGGEAASDGVKRRAQEYVTNNYGNLDIKDNLVWSEEVTENKTENGATLSVKTTHRYCRVDLEDTVQTFFARIFGIDSLTVKVSALALMDGSVNNDSTKKLLEKIAKKIEEMIPSILWENITKKGYVGQIIDSRSNYTESTLKKDNSSDVLGEKNNRYYAVTGGGKSVSANQEIDPIAFGLWDATEGKYIIGYQEPVAVDSVCAAPIYSAASWDILKIRVRKRIFNLKDESEIAYYGENKIVGLFLNRDNLPSKNYPDYPGAREKFTEINFYKLTGASTAPLYARLESEPIRIGDKGLMTVHGVTVNVLLKEAEYSDGEVRPIVLAYDGPDMGRGDKDAPWVATKAVTFKNQDLNPGQIQSNIEPGLDYFTREEAAAAGVVQTAIKTSAPVYVNIPSNCVLYGAIYAPRSKVIIRGGGKIIGFIAAREIEGDWAGGTLEGPVEMEMPVYIAEHPANDNRHDFYNYRRVYVKGSYYMAYTGSPIVSFMNL